MEQQKFVRKNMAIYDAQRRQDKKRKRRTVFYVILFVMVSLVFIAIATAVFLKVSKVTISGNSRYSDKQIRSLVPIAVGDNMFSFDAESIEQAICDKYPYVDSVEIKRDLPTTVEVIVKEEKPYYLSEIAGEQYVLSADLKVLERLEDEQGIDTELTSLSLNNVRRCIVGDELEFVDKRTYDAILSLYENFTANYIDDKVLGVDVRSRFDIYINYDNRFEVYLGDIDSIDIKIRFLVGIIDELEPDATGTIDVSNHREASVALT